MIPKWKTASGGIKLKYMQDQGFSIALIADAKKC